ncbi:MAG: thiamine-phosphate kinase [Pseudomonadales bacterium]|jgi:thiamine-monophosphate kinase|nr:thiamine-phosphate kinase [Pseudomonadales bacterium]HJN50951.1 thiamine-phosphate kinase [Pseudomonadales bacterium]|tara:strand:- start:140 stop:1114 length:975 start_codon:yes stop_codon:yes gene_type:complete
MMETVQEFEIIKRFFIEADYPLTKDLSLGPGDDCAILNAPPGKRLCFSIDTLVAGVHFPSSASADVIAHRSLAVNVSDLAAMGASPAVFVLALTLPEFDAIWLREFSTSLAGCAHKYAIALAGGDLTRGPLSITMQVTGMLPDDAALKRSGAVIDDDIYVTGFLGDAAAGLQLSKQNGPPRSSDEDYLYGRFAYPEARVSAGRGLLRLATSAIDISDGLLADLGHIADSSNTGALVYSHRIPLSGQLLAHVAGREALDYALSGGDDYELCFTAPEGQRSAIEQVAQDSGVTMTRIGKIVAGRQITCVDDSGNEVIAAARGYHHF